MPRPRSASPFTRLRAALRGAGLGRLYYRVAHGSFPHLRWRLRFGPFGFWRYTLGEAAMIRAVSRLAPVDGGAAEGLACSFLTGKRYWHQTAFCAHSLARVVPAGIRATIYDDGTLTRSQGAALRRVLRGATIVSSAESVALLDARLPRARFPLLRAARDAMPMMRKLVDVRAGSTGWQLLLDSDMIFHSRPDFLLERFQNRGACHMIDHVHGYIEPEDSLAAIWGFRVPPRVNAGIVALDDARIDWPQVEHWLGKLPGELRGRQMLEQTLTAVLLGLQHSIPAPAEEYHILYDSESPEPPETILLHFIYHAKLRYFTRDWRRYLTSCIRPVFP